jgi:hypothetical protein
MLQQFRLGLLGHLVEILFHLLRLRGLGGRIAVLIKNP